MKPEFSGLTGVLWLHPSHRSAMRSTSIIVLLLSLGLVLAWSLPPLPEASVIAGYLPLHNLLETIAIVIAMMVFAVSWNAYTPVLPGNIVLLACVFLGVGLLDFSHLLSYAGMPDYVTPSSPEKSIYFWLVARTLGAIVLLVVAVSPWRPLASAAIRYVLLAAVLVVISLLHWLFFVHPELLPRTFIPGQGLTRFKIYLEYAIIATNIAAGLALWLRMRKPQSFDAAALFGAVCVMALSEFFFTLYADVTDIYNLLGHIYKTVSYLFIYRAIFVATVESPYARLSASQGQLQATLNALPDLMFEVGLDGRFHDYHSSSNESLMAPPNLFLGKLISDVLPPDVTQIAMLALLEANKFGHAKGEYVLELPQGKFWYGFSVARKPAASGEEPRFIWLVHDITAIKHGETALAESHNLLQAVIDAAPLRIFWKDTELRYLGCNPAFARDAGVASPQEIIGKTDDQLGWKERVALYRADEHQILDSGIPKLSYDEALSAPDGKTIWLRSSKVPLRGSGNETIGLLGIYQDITEQKLAELSLRASEESLKESQVIASLGSYTLDLQTGIWISSGELDWLLGIDDEYDHSVQGWEALLHPEDSTMMVEYFKEEVIGLCKNFDKEYRIIRHCNQSERWVHGLGKLDFDEHGRPVKMHGTIQDITERKRVGEQLRKLAQAVEQSPESIVITNLAVEIEYVNEAFTRATGYSREEVIGQNPRILHSGKTRRETYLSMWDALSQGFPWKGEFFNKRKDGSEFVEFAIITPLRQLDGRITHYVAVKEDVTEKIRLAEELDRHRHHLEELVEQRTEELIAARQQAEAANLAKSSFLANMSHEIRTPMNAILGLTHLLRHAGTTPQQSERLSKIDSAGQHLLSIINDTLDLSKIEAGRMQLEHKDFHLAAVLDSVASLIGESAHAKGLRIELDSDHVPLWLCGDATRLRQALLNFASNAVKFTERGTIVLRAFLLEEKGDELRVRFEVEDTGIGVAPDALDRLFHAFEQADTSTTRKYGGTGLGLVITRRLTQLMGGEAGINSTPGKGSTFWFTARLQRGHGLMPAVLATDRLNAETQLRKLYSGTRILLAEDNPVNREVALELLQVAGLAVDAAEDGLQALKLAQAQAYDLILMDMQMPNMHGLDATRAIRALPGHARTPILAMTANAFDENRRACEAAGMNDFIAKPVDHEMLYATLLKWLSAATANMPHQADGTSGPAEKIVPATNAPPTLAGNTTAEDALMRLSRESGLNVSRGLNALRGNTAKYLDLLNRFAVKHADDMIKLAESLDKGDPASAVRFAHTIKGTAATLGADRLSEMARQLEEKLRRQQVMPLRSDDIRAEMDDISHEFIVLLGHMPPPLPAASIPDNTPPNPENMNKVLRELDALLQLSDTSAITLLEGNIQLLRAALGSSFEKLANQIKAFDFDKARETLQRLH